MSTDSKGGVGFPCRRTSRNRSESTSLLTRCWRCIAHWRYSPHVGEELHLYLILIPRVHQSSTYPPGDCRTTIPFICFFRSTAPEMAEDGRRYSPSFSSITNGVDISVSSCVVSPQDIAYSHSRCSCLLGQGGERIWSRCRESTVSEAAEFTESCVLRV